MPKPTLFAPLRTPCPTTSSKSRKHKGLLDLTDNLLVKILALLDVKSVLRIQRANKRFNRLITTNASKLRTIKEVVLWFVISATEKRYLAFDGFEDELLPESEEIWAMKGQDSHPFYPQHLVTFLDVPFVIYDYRDFFGRPVFVAEPFNVNVTEYQLIDALKKALEVLLRHIRPFHISTDSATWMLNDLVLYFPKCITSVLYDHNVTTNWREYELLQFLERLPLLTDFTAAARLRLSFDFYQHAIIQDLEGFKYDGPVVPEAENWRAEEYLRDARKETVNDEVLGAVKWRRGWIREANVTSSGINGFIHDWIEHKREVDSFTILPKKGNSINIEDALEDLNVMRTGEDRFVAQRDKDQNQLEITFVCPHLVSVSKGRDFELRNAPPEAIYFRRRKFGDDVADFYRGELSEK